MTRDGVEGGARFPAAAVPHWESYGWRRTDPPAKPTRPGSTTTQQADPPSTETLDAGDKTADTTTKQKPSNRRKED